MLPEDQVFSIKNILDLEAEHISERRKSKNKNPNIEEDSFGIALSGGGIRSATICLGILEELNKKGLLQEADYLSSVSGGGYIASYIHTSLNDSATSKAYDELFDEETINHLRKNGDYLSILKGGGFIRNTLNKLTLLFIAIEGTILNALWWIAPVLYLIFFRDNVSNFIAEHTDNIIPFYLHLIFAFIFSLILGCIFSPNFTSPHYFYKSRLSKTFLKKRKKIKLWELNNPLSPYPLINATVNVNHDSYSKIGKVVYRGQINSNYFLFSPMFCGSQVTGYVESKNDNYKSMKLSTAMTTSAAAVNTFMGNQNLPSIVRTIMTLFNLRTGILGQNPQMKKKRLAFWPKYTFLELIGNSDTTTRRIQLSDGGHVENLAVYELLRRQAKIIIAIDAGEDENFEFTDLKNLIVRSKNELGMDIQFHKNAEPQKIIKPNIAHGFSDNYFVVAKTVGMEGSYSHPFEGIIIYIKSSMRDRKQFLLRILKNKVKDLSKSGENTKGYKDAKRHLDSYMHRTYNPKFPHDSTADQFFDATQWDAYHDLGKEIGQNICNELNITKGDSGKELLEKSRKYYERYGRINL